jgi:hypothetical protein
MNSMFETALQWGSRGVAVIPLWPGQKTPTRSWKEYQKRLPTKEEVRRWFNHPNPCNMGIVTGWNNLTVLDFDSLDWYFLWAELYNLNTYQVMTSRGVHVYLYTGQPARILGIPGILDLQAAGHYVVGAGSLHPSGWVYAVLNDAPIAHVDRVEEVLPDGLLDIQPMQQSGPAPAVSVETAKLTPADPFAMLDKVGVDPISTIKKRYTPLDFLPGARPSSPDGRWYLTCCPFHNDHNPSFWVDAARGLCGCHAGCTPKALDVINLYGRLRNISDREAIRELLSL